MILEEKLEKFKSGTAVLNTPTQEIYDRLMIELEKRGYKWCSGRGASDNPSDRWGDTKEMTCVSNRTNGMYYCDRTYYESRNLSILEITEEDFTAPSETVESVMKSIEEVKADLKFYDELFKKYGVVIAGNLESTMRERLESLLKKRVIS